MTRIIAGTARGRKLQVPKQGTRPTADRIRESLFSSLDHQLGSWSGVAVLDLYAGSGALALEALSRGGGLATAVESGSQACAVIRANSASLDLPVTVVRSDVVTWVRSGSGSKFDLVFIDPPYEVDSAELSGLLRELAQREVLSDQAVVVVERATRSANLDWPEGFDQVTDRRFGDTKVSRAVWYVSGNPN